MSYKRCPQWVENTLKYKVKNKWTKKYNNLNVFLYITMEERLESQDLFIENWLDIINSTSIFRTMDVIEMVPWWYLSSGINIIAL